MKSSLIRLTDNDQKARDWIRENLEVCAWGHTLSKKILERFSTATGSLIAIVPDWVDLGQLVKYSHGSVPPNRSPYGKGDSPTDRLVTYVDEFLQTKSDGVVVCENSATARKTLEIWTWSRPPRFSGYGDDDIYYILEASDPDPEMIDAALSDSLRGHSGVAVCSFASPIPDGDMPDESSLNLIIENMKHVLMPAFDNDGYLIWSPAV